MSNTRKAVRTANKAPTLKTDIDLKNLPELESSDSRIILSVLLNKFDELKCEFAAALQEKSLEISNLKEHVNLLQSKITSLELQMDEADSYERRDTLIMSGEALPLHSQGEVTSEVARALILDKLKVSLPINSISTCHRLGRKPLTQSPDRRSIVIKFCQRDVKTQLLVSSRKARITNFYINESLSPKRSKIFYALRQIKKAHPNLVSGCTSYDGKIYVYTKPSGTAPVSSRNLRHAINSKEQLNDFCVSFIKQPLENFLSNWTE